MTIVHRTIAFDESRNPIIREEAGATKLLLLGRSVIVGSQKTQIYQWFAGGQQEVFILKILKFENNTAYVDSRRRFYIAQLIILL